MDEYREATWEEIKEAIRLSLARKTIVEIMTKQR